MIVHRIVKRPEGGDPITAGDQDSYRDAPWSSDSIIGVVEKFERRGRNMAPGPGLMSLRAAELRSVIVALDRRLKPAVLPLRGGSNRV